MFDLRGGDLLRRRRQRVHKLRGRFGPSCYGRIKLQCVRCWDIFSLDWFSGAQLRKLRGGLLPGSWWGDKLRKLCCGKVSLDHWRIGIVKLWRLPHRQHRGGGFGELYRLPRRHL